MANKNNYMNGAKRAKLDEFYTQLADIENELKHYQDQFKDKVVYCNCDDPLKSNFVKYFKDNFHKLGLAKLLASHYVYTDLFTDGTAYQYEYDGQIETTLPLQDNGDFRSLECVRLLKEADIVVTNPPFSLFREYMAQLIQFDKKFLIIGSITAISCKEIFPLVKENQVWLGPSIINGGVKFEVPNSFLDTEKFTGEILDSVYYQKVPGVRWFTNLPRMRLGYNFNKALPFIIPDDYGKHHHIDEAGNKIAIVTGISWFTNLEVKQHRPFITLYKKYSPRQYPKYDNYNAINVDKVADIPVDWAGEMGVPVTFMDKYNPKQFEILDLIHCPHVKGKGIFSRIAIRNRNPESRVEEQTAEEEQEPVAGDNDPQYRIFE